MMIPSIKTLLLSAAIVAAPLAGAFPSLTPAFELSVCLASGLSCTHVWARVWVEGLLDVWLMWLGLVGGGECDEDWGVE